MKAWIEAFRLRTLPLSLSCIILGTLLAASYSEFQWQTALWAFLTTLFLQILSNLANDYGDGVKGTDNHERVGPARAIQSGAITHEAMKKALYIFAGLSFLSGIILLWVSLNTWKEWAFFLVAGIGAIWAAIQYTVGKNAYGYKGMGDLFVLIFFGWMGTAGTFYLHANELPWEIMLPATSIGFIAVAVLNLNNMRDRISDQKVGKRTLAVMLGEKKAKVYHATILFSAIFLSVVYISVRPTGVWQNLYLIVVPIFVVQIKKVMQNTEPKELDPMLKQTAISALLYSLLFGVGNLL